MNESGWVRVPLRLTRSVLREPAAYQGSGECFVHFDEAVGYIAWVRAAAGTEHRLTLKMATPLATLGSGRRLEVAAPWGDDVAPDARRAAGECRRHGESGCATLESAKPTGEHTQLSVLGVSGDFSLTWHEPDVQIATVPVVLESSGATVRDAR